MRIYWDSSALFNALASKTVFDRSWALLQLFDKHLRIAAALIVFFAAGGRQIVGRSFGKTAFGLEIGEGLRGKGNQLIKAHLPRFALDKLNELAADALIFM